MTILRTGFPRVEFAPAPSSNPRDSWPSWTDERWTTVEPVKAPASIVQRAGDVLFNSWVDAFAGRIRVEVEEAPYEPTDLDLEEYGKYLAEVDGFPESEEVEPTTETDSLDLVHPCELVEAGCRFGSDPRWESTHAAK